MTEDCDESTASILAAATGGGDMIRRALLLVSVAGIPWPVPAEDASYREPPFEIVGASFFAVQVRDDRAAADWYRRALGLEELRHLEAEDGRFSIRILNRGALTVELIRLNSASEASQPRTGLFKVGFFVDDIEAAHTWLEALGADVDDRIFTEETIGARTFVLRDPEENRLQIFQDCGQDCGG